MAYIMVDIESDGPIPGDYSMISFGAVLVDEQLDKTFYGKIKPISEKYIPEALAVSGFSREEKFKYSSSYLELNIRCFLNPSSSISCCSRSETHKLIFCFFSLTISSSKQSSPRGLGMIPNFAPLAKSWIQ